VLQSLQSEQGGFVHGFSPDLYPVLDAVLVIQLHNTHPHV
jgi:hypothetical protein